MDIDIEDIWAQGFNQRYARLFFSLAFSNPLHVGIAIGMVAFRSRLHSYD